MATNRIAQQYLNESLTSLQRVESAKLDFRFGMAVARIFADESKAVGHKLPIPPTVYDIIDNAADVLVEERVPETRWAQD